MKKYRDFAFLQLKHWLGIVVMAVLLASCSNEMMVENLGPADPSEPATLRLMTRSGDGDAGEISYPVSIYVMQSGVCQALTTLTSADEAIAIPLTVGSYDIYAVGGASSDDYDLPSKADATAATVLTLKDGRTHGDLTTASAQATLTAGGDNSVALQLRRKVMMLQTVIVAQVPASVSAVSVTVSPLSEAVTVAGDYSGTQGSATVDLECQADGTTWQAEANQYLLPSAEAPTVDIAITTAEGTHHFARRLDGAFTANTKYSLSANYQAAAQLTADLSAEEWQDDETVDFHFSDDDAADAQGNGGNNNNDNPGDAIPAAGDTYQGCYVLSVTDGDDHADLLLLAPTELTGWYNESTTIATDTDTALGTVTAGNISGWRVPVRTEASLMYSARASIGLSGHYLLSHNNGYRTFDTAYPNFDTTQYPDADTRLRPVAEVTIAK